MRNSTAESSIWKALRSALVFAIVAGSALLAQAASGGWAATWYAPQSDYKEELLPVFPAEPSKMLKDQTIRQILFASISGERVRLKLSNLFGPTPVTLDAVTIAINRGSAGDIDPATSRSVTFGGSKAVTIPAGKEIFSDPVDFAVQANSTLAVSIYAAEAEFRTAHRLAVQRNFITSGDVTNVGSPTWTEVNDTPKTINPGGYSVWVTELDVPRQSSTRVVAAFGDSITDGWGSKNDGNNRWPNALSRIAAADPAVFGRMSVVNAGISGNRWLTDWEGPAGDVRFGRDVLGVSGVTHVVIMLGINDIGYDQFVPQQIKDAPEIKNSIQMAVNKAKAGGLKVIVATLAPFKPSPLYYSDARDLKRQAVNQFIRKGLRNADAVVDFDQLLRDPANPLQMLPVFDSGDHLHPNDAGYGLMAGAVAAKLQALIKDEATQRSARRASK